MPRYALEFTKRGYIKYISHLDMTRLFKRVFKRQGIELRYSNGYNPHPRMVFANPLPLGYESRGEFLEIETVSELEAEDIRARLNAGLPEGIRIIAAEERAAGKTLAARCSAAVYLIYIPVEEREVRQGIIDGYLCQERIWAFKRQKKTGEMIPTDIKEGIRELSGTYENGTFVLRLAAELRNEHVLSPEQVISSFLEYSGWDVKRKDIEVERIRLEFIDKQ